jgi:ABC-type lipoprotein export system ATPase subunit
MPLLIRRVSVRDATAEATRLLERVGLGARLHHRPGQLSGGERQRAAVARALVTKPQVVLADEPTGNLDPDSAAIVLALLRAVIKGQGAAGILVTHSQAAAQTTDRTLLLTREGMRELESP